MVAPQDPRKRLACWPLLATFPEGVSSILAPSYPGAPGAAPTRAHAALLAASLPKHSCDLELPGRKTAAWIKATEHLAAPPEVATGVPSCRSGQDQGAEEGGRTQVEQRKVGGLGGLLAPRAPSCLRGTGGTVLDAVRVTLWYDCTRQGGDRH